LNYDSYEQYIDNKLEVVFVNNRILSDKDYVRTIFKQSLSEWWAFAIQ